MCEVERAEAEGQARRGKEGSHFILSATESSGGACSSPTSGSFGETLSNTRYDTITVLNVFHKRKNIKL